MTSILDHTQFFARIHIHGLTSRHGDPHPITLERYVSFPAPVCARTCQEVTTSDINLSPRVLQPVFELTARVLYDDPKPRREYGSPQHSIGYGRAGLVYRLEVVSVIGPSGTRTDDLIPLLPPLCIKVATPGYARSLAREAWFYEYLDANGLTGIVTPRCYGVFHTAVANAGASGDLKVDIVGYNYYSNASKPLYDDFPLFTARLPEEQYSPDTNTLSLAKFYVDDMHGSYMSSRWRLFREGPRSTTLTVLVMDLLGEPMTVPDFEQNWADDIQSIYDHLIPLSIIHGDDRFPNILRAPAHVLSSCKMHGSRHGWHLVDWENAVVHCTNLHSGWLLKTQCLLLRDFASSVGCPTHYKRRRK